ALLAYYTGRYDINIGSGIANRRWRETEGLLGMIINTVVLRTDLSGNPTLRELTERVREVCLGAYSHQDVPFEKVVEELRPERSTDLFDDATITHLLAHYERVLEAFVENPGLRLADLQLLSKSEGRQLLVDCNETQTDYPQLCIHELFREQAQQTPDAVALVFADEQMTHRELTERAQQLAAYLRSRGVGPEVPI